MKERRARVSFTIAELLGLGVTVMGSGIQLRVPEDAAQRRAYLDSFDADTNWLQLGWMGNDAHFYENAVAKAVLPQPEDFYEVPFRLLSATTVGAGSWKATDFSDAKILKASKNKLKGKGVYKDHETDSNNVAGIVKGVKWTEAFKDASGVMVPAGIDGVLALDMKTQPKLVRDVAMGAIYSNSVTVDFNYKMSHEYADEYAFMRNVGTIHPSDKMMVRRVVTGINDYHETSLLWLGADPFSKRIKETGDLTNIDKAGIYSYGKDKIYSFASTKLQQDKVTFDEEDEAIQTKAKEFRSFSINFAVNKDLLPLAHIEQTVEVTTTETEQPEHKNSEKMNKFLLAFLKAFGKDMGLSFALPTNVDEFAPSDEQLTEITNSLSRFGLAISDTDRSRLTSYSAVEAAALTAFRATEGNGEAEAVPDMTAFLASHSFIANSRVAALTAVETSYNTIVAAIGEGDGTPAQRLEALTAMAATGTSYMTNLRTEAIRLYKATVGADKVSAAVVKLMQDSKDESVLKGLLEQYVSGSAVTKFKGHCKDCGSGNFSFQSSITDDAGIVIEGNTPSANVVTAGDLYNTFNKKPMYMGAGEEQATK